MKSIYTISKYTHIFKSSKGQYLLYNSRSNTFLELTTNLYDFLLRAKENANILNNADTEVLDFLHKRKIIVTQFEDDDYLLECQYCTNTITYDKETLGLTLVPTLDCNCNCFYCFEKNKRAEKMDEKTIDAIISFINEHTESKYLSLSWFGGEPLLELGIIENILDRIAEETNKEINGHSITTNGTLFNDAAINLFKDFPLHSIQITLDGEKKRHDSIRKLKNGNVGTYDNILKNIDNIVEQLPDTDVSIRVNVEKKNIDDFHHIENIIESRWKGKNVHATPGFLQIDNKEKTDLSCTVFNNFERAQLMFDMGMKSNSNMFPSLHPIKGCMATMQNAFIILPNGDMCKCMNDVSNPKRVIGNIVTKQALNPTLLYRYMTVSKWYNNEGCKKCFFLPVCNGICAKDAMRNKYEDAKYDLCDCNYKHHGMLEKYLEAFFEYQQHANEES